MRLRSVAQIQRFLQCFEIPIRLTKRGLVVVSSRIGSANCWLPEKPFRPADTWRSQSEYEPTNEDATHALADSFPLLIFLGFISPLIALVSALVFYAHHRERVEPERRVPVIAFILVLIACGVGAGLFGLYLGLELACKPPEPRQSLRTMGILGYRSDLDRLRDFPRRTHNLFDSAPCRVMEAIRDLILGQQSQWQDRRNSGWNFPPKF
jgi:hypothetical protein